MSRFDVIVPCYRYAHYLRGCAESVLSQSVRDVRVLIIDDASPDHTAEVAEKLVAEDVRVHFRRHQVNRGHIATYNEGLDWAEGDYTILLSADDLLAPGALARAIKVLDAHPELGMVYGRGIIHRLETSPVWDRTDSDRADEIISGGAFLEACCREARNVVCTPTAIVRTRLQKVVGGYREELPHSGDMEMWMRFAAHADLGVIWQVQACYRTHGANMHLKTFGSKLTESRQRKKAFDFVFDINGGRIHDAQRLRDIAMTVIAREALDDAYDAFQNRDVAGCRGLAALAAESLPEVRSWRLYRRLRWMLRAGPGLWLPLSRMSSRLRQV